jgi:hypothetical protein
LDKYDKEWLGFLKRVVECEDSYHVWNYNAHKECGEHVALEIFAIYINFGYLFFILKFESSIFYYFN